MKPKTFMLIAGEASGDLLAAELVSALRGQLPDAQFFGAGGAQMSAAGVELAFDLTLHSVVGLTDVLKNILKFRRLFQQLLALAIERKPDVVIGVDYGGFNLRFGSAIRKYVRENPFVKWNPKIVQFVSPQVWASRPGRADKLARDYDLLLSIFPFEKDWYAKRVPQLRVEFVGHPMLDRFATAKTSALPDFLNWANAPHDYPVIILLPGSRPTELEKHLPVMLRAVWKIVQKQGFRLICVLPNEALVAQAKKLALQTGWPDLIFKVGELPTALRFAAVAIASTGTVTMECAFFGVPTVTLYKTSWLTYQIARHLITVKSLTMPNLLAGELVYPEFIQNEATPENLSRAALKLLQDEPHRQKIKAQLAKIISSLGEPGAAGRAATAILSLFK